MRLGHEQRAVAEDPQQAVGPISRALMLCAAHRPVGRGSPGLRAGSHRNIRASVATGTVPWPPSMLEPPITLPRNGGQGRDGLLVDDVRRDGERAGGVVVRRQRPAVEAVSGRRGGVDVTGIVDDVDRSVLVVRRLEVEQRALGGGGRVPIR